MNPKPHALVVGGTGMLWEVVHHLVQKGFFVSVVARDEKRLKTMQVEMGGADNLNPIAADYHDEQALRHFLQNATERHGRFSLAVVWIHGSAPMAAEVVAEHVEGAYFHIRPASAGSPTFVDPFNVERLKQMLGVEYHQVILGKGGSGERWLTNDEIATGVIDAIGKSVPSCIVGRL